MKAIFNRKEIILYCVFAILLGIIAGLGKWDNTSFIYIVNLPFAAMGDGIRNIGSHSGAGATTVYVLLCIVPLVLPVVRTIATRRIVARELMWVALSAFLFIVMYFFINPHKITTVFDSLADTGYMRTAMLSAIMSGFSVTFLVAFMLCLVGEMLVGIKRSEDAAYKYAKIIFVLVILALLINYFFIKVAQAKVAISSIIAVNGEIISIDKSANIATVIVTLLLELAPMLVGIVILLQAKNLINNLQQDAFRVTNISKLKMLSRSCLVSIFVTLTVVIVQNIIMLVLSNKLIDIMYKAELPIALMLVVSIVMILSQIMIKAIKVNEENKLVI